jgi:hypothetical protein
MRGKPLSMPAVALAPAEMFRCARGRIEEVQLHENVIPTAFRCMITACRRKDLPALGLFFSETYVRVPQTFAGSRIAHIKRKMMK